MAVVGAIMRYAITVKTPGFSINTAGMIILWVGVGLTLLSVAMVAMGGRSSSTSQQTIQNTAGGQVRTEERVDNIPL